MSTGPLLVRASWVGTAVHAMVALVAVVLGGDGPHIAHLVVAGILFVGGSVAMVATIVLAADRSRTSLIGIGGLFLASGSAPARTARILQGSLAVSVAVSIGAAAVRPYTPLAFGTLVPLWPLGLMGVWCARHGTFPRR